MDLREVEALLTELESRTDRLRALYEQYFLGFERLEPQVVRKDVERRMQALLRVPFRNTALRFRFTMLQQRYNTYQTYWMRTCRKIEDGTYKRQLQRLKAKDADILRNVEAAKEDLAINVKAMIDHVVSIRPQAVKGNYFRKATLTSTMGPGLRLSL